jgi:PIN domain
MINLYIETNFFIDFAKNQDQNTGNLVYSQSPELTTRIKIVTPAICCMESLSVLKSERNRSNWSSDNLENEIRKVKGDANSQYSRDIKLYLRKAILKNSERMNEINNRLFDVLKWAKNSVELIQLKPDVLSKSLDNILINDPTDNLILHCILDHAKTSTNEKKVFLSGNSTDFGNPEIKRKLEEAGIQKYLVKTGDFLGWLNSQV